MYERFTDRARKVMQLAYEEAQRLGSPSVATEHLLLGLLKEGSGVAAHVLRDGAVDLNLLLRAVESKSPKPARDIKPATVPRRSPWWRLVIALTPWTCPHRLRQSPDFKATIEAAMHEARSLRHGYIGTEHLLLGMLHKPNTEAARLLTAQGLKLDAVRRETLALLGAASA